MRRTRFFWIGRFVVGPLRRWAEHIDTSRGLRTIGVTGVVFALGSLLAIAIQTDGLINANEGVWVALVAALLVTAGGYLKPEIRVLDPADVALAAWLEIIIIAVVVG